MRGGGPIVAGVLLVLAAACSGPQAQSSAHQAAAPTLDATPVTVTVGQIPATLYAPLYVAVERGYFSQLHVTVRLPTIRPGQNLIDLLSRGEVDVAVTDFNADLFNALGRGQKLRVVGSMAAMPGDGTRPVALEVAKSLTDAGKVKTPADLKGRTIVIEGGDGSGNGYLADSILKSGGVSLKDMTVGDLAAAATQAGFGAGGIDAALVSAPYTTAIEQRGLAAPLAAPAPGTTWSGVVYGPKLSGSAGLRFFDALVRAARDLVGTARTSDDTLAILAKYTGRPADQLKAMPPFVWDANLRADPAGLTAIQATYRELGVLQYPTDVAATRFVDASYSKQAAIAVR